jgi:hypothetical protein
MDDELLYDELRREGFESCVEYCLKNWDELNITEKQALRAVGICPKRD